MRFTLHVGSKTHDVLLSREGDRYKVEVDGTLVEAEVQRGRTSTTVVIGGQNFEIEVGRGDVVVNGASVPVKLENLEAGVGPGHHAAGSHGRVKPPMPGKIVAVRVAVGATVKAGETLVVLEAMKMQNEISSPVAGVVKEIRVKPGQTVEPKDLLVVIE